MPEVIAPASQEFELRQADALERLFARYAPQIVLHAVAVLGRTGATRANPGRFFFANAVIGLLVIDAARRHETEETVALGTVRACLKHTMLQFNENELWNGYAEEINARCGVAKRALLVQCQAYHAQYALSAIFLLPVNFDRPGDNFDRETPRVIPGLILECVESVEEGQEVTALWGDGSPTREFLHAGDAADGIIEAVEQYDKPEPVSIGIEEEISIQSLAEQIAVLSGFTGRVVWDTLQPNGQPRRRLGTSRAECEFGFRARTSFYGGLREIIEWHVNARGGGLSRGGSRAMRQATPSSAGEERCSGMIRWMILWN